MTPEETSVKLYGKDIVLKIELARILIELFKDRPMLNVDTFLEAHTKLYKQITNGESETTMG